MEENDKNEFEKDRSIDPGQLDLECTQQPDLFFKWAERAVEAKKALDNAKFNLEVLEANLAIKIRRNPINYSLHKLTDTGVKTAIQNHPRYKEAYGRYLDIKGDSLLLDKAVEAMEQKKRMLEVLITLHGQEYFAGPSTPRNLVSAWKEAHEAQEKRLLERQREVIRGRKSKEVADD